MASDNCAKQSDLHNATEFFHIGLRGNKLMVLICAVVVMWFLTIINLACNLMLLISLKVSRDGMQSLHFGSTDDGETVVQFSPAETHLEHLISKTGTVSGYQGANFDIDSQRIVMLTKRHLVSTSVRVDENGVAISDVDNFAVVNMRSAQRIFETKNPTFRLPKSIKKIATSIVKTKKIRAPTGGSLKFLVDNLSLRGNEGTRFRSRNLKLSSAQSINLRTGNQGILNITVPNGVFLVKAIDLPLSPSPSLKANILGFRLCSCAITGKLFAVGGNANCANDMAKCY